MQTFVKLTLRFTTNVTTSPACRRRSSSATSVNAWTSRPLASASSIASATETSSPSSARESTRRTSAEAQSSVMPGTLPLPGAPVLMSFLYQTVGVDQRADAGTQALGQELRARCIFGVDGETFAERVAEALGRTPQLGDQRPRRFRIDVVDRQRRDPAPVVETGGEQSRIDTRREVRRRLDVDVGAEHEPRHGQRAQHVVESRLGLPVHGNTRLGPEVLDDDFLHVAVALVGSRIAHSASTRSRGTSPMPMRIPVVKGIWSLPASSIVRNRRAGTLSGALSWARPGPSSRDDTLSSMRPMLTLTSRSAARSRSLITPGLTCGRSDDSRSVSSQIARRYWSVVRWPCRRKKSRCTAKRASGLSPRENSASFAPNLWPA